MKKFGLRLKRAVKNAIFKFFPLSSFQISHDYCQKSHYKTILFYNGFRGFLRSSTVTSVFDLHILTMERRLF